MRRSRRLTKIPGLENSRDEVWCRNGKLICAFTQPGRRSMALPVDIAWLLESPSISYNLPVLGNNRRDINRSGSCYSSRNQLELRMDHRRSDLLQICQWLVSSCFSNLSRFTAAIYVYISRLSHDHYGYQEYMLSMSRSVSCLCYYGMCVSPCRPLLGRQ